MISKEKGRFRYIIGIIFFIILLASFLESRNYNIVSSKMSDTNFNILDFWDKEIERVNNTDLNISFGNNETIKHETTEHAKYEFKAQNIYFDSPNWVGATNQTIRLHGYLLFPFENQSIYAGCLCMHGLNSEISGIFDLAIPFLEKGFIVLAHSHPGHGESEGAEPRPENLFYEGAYNESAHFYLSLCGAIQGLRVLENLSFVNNSQIVVTGESYGGLNAMWLSGICGDRIAGVIPYISVGDIVANLDYPSKLIFWVLGKSPDEIPDSYLTNQLLRFDPIYYLKSAKMPPILWIFGTNDDFFHYSSIINTYKAVQRKDKYLQIFPNEHHGFPNYEDDIKFFIDYVLYNGPAPPLMDDIENNKDSIVNGDSLVINVKLNSSVEIESVQIAYYQKDLIGVCWLKQDMTFKENMTWQGRIYPGILDSRFDYFIIFNVNGTENVWFSSNIYSAGLLRSNYSTTLIILLGLLIGIPISLMIWKKWKKFSSVDRGLKKLVVKAFSVEISLIAVSEIIAFVSLFTPWVVYESGGIIFSHVYFFNNLFTWVLIFGNIAYILTPIFLFIMIGLSIMTISKPLLLGYLKLVYPGILLVLISAMPFVAGSLDPSNLTSNFGIIFPGIGSFLMLSTAILMIFIGIWEKKVKKKLGIYKPLNLFRIFQKRSK